MNQYERTPERAKGFVRKPAPLKFSAFAPDTSFKLKSEYSYEYLDDMVDDQGQHGSCTAHGTVGIAENEYYKHQGGMSRRIEISRRAQYAQTLTNEHPGQSALQDVGADVGDALNIIKTKGIVMEADWPYDVPDSDFLNPVPDHLWRTDVFMFKDFVSVPVDLESMKRALQQHGPLVIGMSWFPEWEEVGYDGKLRTDVSTPNGGHCVKIGTMSDSKNAFRGPNSWGTNWADHGYFWLDYSLIKYITDVYVVKV